MYLKSSMLYLYVETPLHAGAGSGLGAIDLPIQRERYTGIPIIQAPGLKGALKSQHKDALPKPTAELEAVFGPENPVYAGAFGVGDARLLLYPVRSLKGLFAWVTCPDVLHRWQRETALLNNLSFPLPDEPPTGSCFASPGVQDGGQVVLEEYTFTMSNAYSLTSLVAELRAVFPKVMVQGKSIDPNQPPQPPSDLYQHWKTKFTESLVVVRSDDFSELVQQTTQVLTRVRLDRNAKAASNQMLWTEEHLPADSILYAPARATPLRCPKKPASLGKTPLDDKTPPDIEAQAVLDWVKTGLPEVIQIGGDETVGRGLARLTWN